jgi:tetratricopeptide (TPR) repeat protein
MILRKKYTIFVLFGVLLSQFSYSQGGIQDLKKADSLFAAGQFDQAEAVFRQKIKEKANLSGTALLKMAFILSQKNNFSEQLYFLNLYFEKNHDSRVLKKMNQIALENGLKGYELDDVNFLLVLYKQYGLYLLALLMLVGVYVFSVLFFKRYRQSASPVRQRITLFFYLLGLAIIINIPSNYYQTAITKKNNILLREAPSAAAAVTAQITEGHRLNVLGFDDIWLRVVWEGRICFIKQYDVWLLE